MIVLIHFENCYVDPTFEIFPDSNVIYHSFVKVNENFHNFIFPFTSEKISNDEINFKHFFLKVYFKIQNIYLFLYRLGHFSITYINWMQPYYKKIK